MATTDIVIYLLQHLQYKVWFHTYKYYLRWIHHTLVTISCDTAPFLENKTYCFTKFFNLLASGLGPTV